MCKDLLAMGESAYIQGSFDSIPSLVIFRLLQKAPRLSCPAGHLLHRCEGLWAGGANESPCGAVLPGLGVLQSVTTCEKRGLCRRQ